MASKDKHIYAHVAALFQQFNKTRLDLKKREDMKLMDRWIMQLHMVPNDSNLIDKCFELLYEKKSMPQPKDFLEVLANKRRIGPERQVTMNDFRTAANTPWRKALLNFLTTPSQFTGGSQAYYTRLVELAKEHNRTDFHEECMQHLTLTTESSSSKN